MQPGGHAGLVAQQGLVQPGPQQVAGAVAQQLLSMTDAKAIEAREIRRFIWLICAGSWLMRARKLTRSGGQEYSGQFLRRSRGDGLDTGPRGH